MQDTKVPAKSRARSAGAMPRAAADKRWYAVFLAHLSATSNVAASAREADVLPSRVYDARRRDPDFYRAWQEALCEGYEHLEMALVQRLRDGEIKPASGAKRGVRVFDNATALRLLVAHRDSVVRQQALRDVEDTGAILERINVRIDRLRAARVPAPEAQEQADG